MNTHNLVSLRSRNRWMASALAVCAFSGLNAHPVSAQAAVTYGRAFVPPPYNGQVAAALPPAGAPKPDRVYRKNIECVTRNLGENVPLQNKPWGQQHLQLDDVHQLMQSSTGGIGAGVKIAVIDTGVSEHQYLAGRLEAGGDYVDEPLQGLEDCDGHGTEVAGIIAAKTPPEIGFRGMAPDARIVSIRQSSQNYAPEKPAEPGNQPRPNGVSPQASRQQNQDGTAGTVDTLAQAVRHAADFSGVKVINMSVDSCRQADNVITAGEQRLQAAIRYAVDRDIVIVAAAGNVGEHCPQNDQPDPNKPRSLVAPPLFAEDVLSVAAIDKTGGIADFSIHGPWVSVAAPGTEVISLDPIKGSSQLANQVIEGGQERFIQGTSFSAPYVSGLAALIRAKYPHLSARAVMNRITTTAQHPGAHNGRDHFTGFGVINPMAALTAIVPDEVGRQPIQPASSPADIPPLTPRNWTPVYVAFAGTGGGILALLLTFFVLHAARQSRKHDT